MNNFYQKEYQKALKKRYRRRKLLNIRKNIGAFLFRHRLNFLAVLAVVLLLVLFFKLQAMGVSQRRNDSPGGELAIFVLPYIIVTARDAIMDLIDIKKRRK